VGSTGLASWLDGLDVDEKLPSHLWTGFQIKQMSIVGSVSQYVGWMRKRKGKEGRRGRKKKKIGLIFVVESSLFFPFLSW
jgi:hypothetical protein